MGAREERRPCPVHGCTATRDPAHVMCPACWYAVPKVLREAVWRTYRQFSAFSEEALEARETAIAYAERVLTEQGAGVA